MKRTGGILVAFLVILLWCSCKNAEEKKETPVTKTGNKEDSINKANQQTAANPYDPIDISPMDMSYYPADYPKLKMTKAITSPPVARVIYSRPICRAASYFM